MLLNGAIPILEMPQLIARRNGLFFLNRSSMLEIKQKIEELAVPVIERRGAFLVDAQVRNERGGKMVQLFVDTDAGITIAQCAEISREVAKEFDTRRVFEGSYFLEVSSPGIDRPLRLLRQYHKNIGRRFKVRYSGEVEQKIISGKLIAVVGETVTLQPDSGEAVTVSFPHIIESKEELPW